MTYVACATVSSEGFEDNGFERTFTMVRPAGFRYVEFNLWHARWLLDEAIDVLIDRCSQAGLRPAAAYGSGAGSTTRSDLDVAHKLRLVDIASRMGARRVVFGGAPGRDEDAFKRAVSTIAIVARAAEDRGIGVGIENHADFTLETIADYEALLQEVPSPAVGLCIDTGHFEAAGIRLDDVVARLTGRINHIHVKENDEFGVQSFRRFGEGTTDNVGLVSDLVSRGYSGCITVEISPPKDRRTTVEDLRTAYELFARFDQGE